MAKGPKADREKKKLQARPHAIHHTTAKIVLVGDHSVGKSALGHRLIHSQFREQQATHGQQFWVFPELGTHRADGTKCEAILWDFAGQPDYRLVHSLFVDDADLALVLFDASDLHDPLHGVSFWLRHLQTAENRSPVLLVAARTDRGRSSLSRGELEAFCRKHGLAGLVETSAYTGEGIPDLIKRMKSLIRWDEKPATITTTTFMQIRDYVLRLKEQPHGSRSLVTSSELRKGLEGIDPDWRFTDAEMITAIAHLENYGYVKRLQTSRGELRILLQPDRLNNLASSFVLEARRNPKGLGAIDEKRLMAGGFDFPELGDLPAADQDVLLDAVVLLFLEHNICFRETDPLRMVSYLVFPALINLKKPPEEDAATEDGPAYTVSGPTENLFAFLVVLLGYTHTFTRTNQWLNNARYEVGHGLVCGFRQEADREGELDFVLYYAPAVGQPIRTLFQGLFESFLARRNLTVLRYEEMRCSNGHLVNRAVVREAMRHGDEFTFCSRCGDRVALPRAAEPIQLTRRVRAEVEAQRYAAEQRSRFEQAAFRVRAYVAEQKIAAPECFISYAWGVTEHERWVEMRLAADLQKAGIGVVLDRWDAGQIGASLPRFIERVEKVDRIVVVGTPLYRRKYESKEPRTGFVAAAEIDLITKRLFGSVRQNASVLPLLLDGEVRTSLPPMLHERVVADFRDEDAYFATVFDLILVLYQLPANHSAVADLRETLRETLGSPSSSRVESLHRILKDDGGNTPTMVREAAVEQLAHDWRDDPETLPLLQNLAVTNPNPVIRRAALQQLAVGWRSDPRTPELLDDRAQHDSNDEVRGGALHELALGWRPEHSQQTAPLPGTGEPRSLLRYRRETLQRLDRAAAADSSSEIRSFALHQASTLRALRREVWLDWLHGKTEEESFEELPQVDPGFPLLRVLAVRLRDIGPFVDSGIVQLSTADSNYTRQAALLVGENAAGKSTLLRCIALGFLGPDLALLMDGNPERYVRQGSERGVGTIDVLFQLQLDEEIADERDATFCVGIEVRANQRTFHVQEGPIASFGQELPNAAARLNWIRQRKYDRFGFACAYGALRNLTKQTESQSEIPDDLLTRVASLFRSSTSLMDPDLLDRLIRGSSVKVSGGREVQLSRETRNRLGEWLTNLLPALQGTEGSQVSSLALHSIPVALTDLSDGYASVLAFAGHLVYHAALASGDWQRDPAEISGLLLIDEIDLHLHLSWQRSVLPALQKLLPRMQIIATTHSPFVVGSVDSRSVVVLRRDGENICVLTDLPSIDGWRADQIATSDLFGLATSRNIATEMLHQQYAQLLSERGPDDPQVSEYGQRLASLLGYLGEGRVDRETNRLLDEFIADRFQHLDIETRRLVLASAGLKLAD